MQKPTFKLLVGGLIYHETLAALGREWSERMLKYDFDHLMGTSWEPGEIKAFAGGVMWTNEDYVRAHETRTGIPIFGKQILLLDPEGRILHEGVAIGSSAPPEDKKINVSLEKIVETVLTEYVSVYGPIDEEQIPSVMHRIASRLRATEFSNQ